MTGPVDEGGSFESSDSDESRVSFESIDSDESEVSFESIDWGRTDPTSSLGTRTWTFLVAMVALGGAVCYDYFVVPEGNPLVGDWDVTGIDWLTIASLLVVAWFVVWPLATNRRLTHQYWRRLRHNRLAVASLGYLIAFFILGLFGPILVGRPEIQLVPSHQPPFWNSVPSEYVSGCIGPTVNGRCYGTLAHPFGTTGNSRDVLLFVINGMRVALQVSLITATLLAPIATVVGTVAASTGGWVDELAMRYVDLQETIPPFFVYLVAQFVIGPSLLLIVAVFGLLDWGSTSRLVRSEVLKKREAGYVMAAKSSGASSTQIARHHLVPNVSHTVVTAITLQMPTLILIEATLAFLSFGVPGTWSWGTIIATGMRKFPNYWWVATFPVLAMLATVLSFNLLGDALRDVLDPRFDTHGPEASRTQSGEPSVADGTPTDD